ncbi:MAG: DUF4474 domain-containing protein [Acutalibacteraceae bacterium]|nr:DUF4474 domain-containing protein [Acutalibacteraceae bacterium]
MGKKKILILAICAAVVIAGSVAAVAILRGGFDKAGDETTTSSTAPQTEYDYNNYNPGVYEPVDTSDNNILTTFQQILDVTKDAASKNPTKSNANKNPTKAPSNKKPANTTTTKKTGTVSYPGDDMLVDQVIGPDGDQFLGYRYDAAGNFYYTDDKDCWQSNAGFNEVYDIMTPMTAMYIDVLRIRFTYGDKDWMIQLWKGQYGWLLVGAEIGVYTTDAGTYTGEIGDVNHYDCADKEDWLKMEMTCYWKENNKGSYKKAFHREYTEYWWATGFVKGQLTKYTAPRTELKMKARITFKSEEMANLFTLGLRQSGFARALGSNQLADDSFYQNGADVWFLWLTKNHECFPGYEGKNS